MTERWAYLGPEGTFTEQAAELLSRRAPGPVERRPAPTVPAALRAVRDGSVGAAVVALESSVEGSVPVTQDELIHGEPLLITAEAHVPVTFDLLVRPGTELSAVTAVGAHPHGLAQVRSWLEGQLPGARAVVCESNAAAAAAVAAGDLDAAAAAPVAAVTYGLVAAAADIGERHDAVTRFVLLRRPGPVPAPTGNDITSMVLSVDNHPGSLLAVLTEFASRGINLTRLESRPTRSRMGEYVFTVDADGHLTDPAMADVLVALRRRSALWRFLGSYARQDGRGEPLPGFATGSAYREARDAVRRWQLGDFS
ncbi:prephenate dehydratase [Nakamurella leprariae]|uniref:Prephenate dehydratase n=1 Tax=Nakamurella leprariae TaxID=2803911 RepID=A0A939C260_9ACTN|nr:prephenate dehydratase [Nakamurella leprariae]MBM9467802.1 prephenate dehydratase [Nakamurella leprariae]